MTEVNMSQARAHGYGGALSSTEEDEQLRTQLLRLRDQVILGQHPNFKLSSAALEKIRAGIMALSSDPSAGGDAVRGGVNGVSAFAATREQPWQTSALPGLQGQPINGSGTKRDGTSATAAALNPIFLEKSDSLVRAEGQLKRQRLERDLQVQVEKRKQTARGHDPYAQPPSGMNLDRILKNGLFRTPHITALQPSPVSDPSSVFDENDYYSSRVQSEWSSDEGSRKGMEEHIGAAFTHDFERLDGPAVASQPPAEPQQSVSHESSKLTRSHAPSKPAATASNYMYETGNEEDEDEDDEYSPPDASAIDSSRQPARAGDPFTSLDEDDNSDYEPGEITQDSNYPSPLPNTRHLPTEKPMAVPVIHNRLTQIAAPQPNRVSPLAMAKGPSVELELVNGRPEVKRAAAAQSRVSTASPQDTTPPTQGKKARRNKKRKREVAAESSKKPKKRREQASGDTRSPKGPRPQIKHEPVPTPPAPPNPAPYLPESQYRPSFGAYVGNGYADLGHRAQPLSPVVASNESSPGYRTVQRDSQDLRRVASFRYAEQQPQPTPRERQFSPIAPYRTIAFNESQPPPPPHREVYNDEAQREVYGQARDEYNRSYRAPSPPRFQEIREPFTPREQSPAPMQATRRIVVDQYGNRYYAADPAPAPQQAARSSVAPADWMPPPPQPSYERAQSRMSYSQAPAPPPPPPHRYEYEDERMAAPSTYRQREYSTRAAEPQRWVEAPTSPMYTSVQPYQSMAPPPVPQIREQQVREPTSPAYQPLPRSYSVRPEEQQFEYGYRPRQATVAPGPYHPHEMPPPPPNRAVSVMPGAEYGTPAQQHQQMRVYAQPQSQPPPRPQSVVRQIYVDQHGNEVFPTEVRQVYH